MVVDPKTATFSARHGNRDYYFCSEKCHDRFVANPSNFAEAEAPQSKPENVAAGTIYTCPMHPQIRQDHPAT